MTWSIDTQAAPGFASVRRELVDGVTDAPSEMITNGNRTSTIDSAGFNSGIGKRQPYLDKRRRCIGICLNSVDTELELLGELMGAAQLFVAAVAGAIDAVEQGTKNTHGRSLSMCSSR